MFARSVLLIDSDCALRRVVEKFFEFARIQVVGGSTCESALAVLGTECHGDFDALVASMDDLAIWEVDLLRSRLPETPTLLIGYPPLPDLGLPSLVKPFPPERLLSRVRRDLWRGRRFEGRAVAR
jgi:DNA-binding response OmpR family regulator